MQLSSIIFELEHFWEKHHCTILPAFDMEVGAGTMAPYTFFRVLSRRSANICYVQPSRRPTDGRYAENPNRVYKHLQMQVIIKPVPEDIQAVYLKSLASLGISTKEHDIRFIEDNWEAPTLGAWGVGWEVWLDGMEITQFTYFQQAGGLELTEPAVEITYGLERLSMYIQDKESIYDMQVGEFDSYRDLRYLDEKEQSAYCHEIADKGRLFSMFDICHEEGQHCIEHKLILPAYEYALKCSHFFNILDTRGALSVNERSRYLGRIRKLVKQCAQRFIEGEKDA
jgi:glycyl-tRNA synthetase alpha chain